MTRADLAGVMALEQQNPGPWLEQQLAGELIHAHGWQWLAKAPADNAIIGYVIGRTVTDEAEILKIAVAEGHRRQGVAQRLLDHALAAMRAAGVTSCFLELRAGNFAARNLYGKNGFVASGLRKGYYSSPGEDALVMTKTFVE